LKNIASIDIIKPYNEVNVACPSFPTILNNLSAEPPIHFLEFVSPFRFALLIIATVAISGSIASGIVGGSVIIGFAVPAVLTSVIIAIRAHHNTSKAIFVALAMISLVSVTLGALTITDYISPFTAGWIMIGPDVVIGSLFALGSCCMPCLTLASISC